MTPFVIIDVDTSTDKQLLSEIAEAATIWSGPQGTGRESPLGWDASASVRVASSPSDVLPGEVRIFLLQNPDQPNAEGYHDRDASGRPIIKVFVGLLDNPAEELAGVMTHEIIEALVDPQLSRTSIGKDSRIRATEPGDPVETLNVPVTIASGKTVQCSAWVTPAWFEPPDDLTNVPLAVGTGTNAVTSPGQTLPGGYMSFYDPMTETWSQEINGEMRGYRARLAARGLGRTAMRAEKHTED